MNRTDDGIKIPKSTAYLAVGLLIAVLIGGYVVFGAGGAAGGAKTAPQNNSANAKAGNAGPADAPVPAGGTAPGNGAVQDIYIKALANGQYDKQEITVKSGEPVRLHFTADPNAGCGRQVVVYGLGSNVKAVSKAGEEDTVDFTPDQPGRYEISCGMKMWGPSWLVVE